MQCAVLEGSSATPAPACFQSVEVLIVRVLVVPQKNDDTGAYQALSSQLRTLRKLNRHSRIIFDFSQVREMTADAFGLFVHFRRKLCESERDAVLCGLCESLIEKLALLPGYKAQLLIASTLEDARALCA